MAAVRRAGWFLGQENKSGDAFLGGGNGGWSSSREAVPRALAPAPAVAVAHPAKAAAAARQQPWSSAMAARITPAVLFITVVLSVVLLVSGLLHILRWLFLKSHHANARAEAVERQLQQLFHLHEDDSAGFGFDQADIDALPAFAYGELAGAKGEKRPFDCAVCLCEFAGDDRLRLLPLCGHAFHAACIDTWLRSSSTCPLCRDALSARALAAPTAAADSSVEPDIEEQKQEQVEASNECAGSVVLPVRLGRFKNLQGSAAGEASTSSCLDARRCYSMGSYQYVLADDNLVLSVHWKPGNGSCRSTATGVTTTVSSHDQQSKKVCAGGRGDSFSVSKIWQWRGGDRRIPGLRAGASSPADDGLPWAPARQNGTCTRQESDT